MAGNLDRYRAKRDFARTREPAGKAPDSGSADAPWGGRYVMQKHAARRLHYDLRLEMDGVLKSWAVTKGPSLVPGDKRLAVHVEDHPIDYGAFEGVIPQGEYGGGSVIVWDRGFWRPLTDPHKGYAKGHLEFVIEGEKLKGRWHLVRMRGRPGEKADNWLLIKAEAEAARSPEEPVITDEAPFSVASGRDVAELGDGDPRWSAATGRAEPAPASSALVKAKPKTRTAKAGPASQKTGEATLLGADAARRQTPATLPGARRGPMPAFLAPSLASAVEHPPEGDRWIHEVKYDGYRLQAHLVDGRVRLVTRGALDWTQRFAGADFLHEIAELGARKALLDGEVLVEDNGGLSDFSALQADLAEGRTDRFVYYAFDLLHQDDFDLSRVPLLARKQALEALLARAPRHALRYSEYMAGGGAVLLRHACRLGLEGIVSKLKDAPYRSGRSHDWLKAKCSERDEFVVAGFMPSTASPKAVGSLLLGEYTGGELAYVGKVGSGFSSAVSHRLFALLEPSRIAKAPFGAPLPAEAARGARFTTPALVAEVEYRGRSATNVIRHATFKGLREDRLPADIVRQTPIARPVPETPRSNIVLTHPDRILWPDAGVTKQGLADFYAEIWDWIGPYVTRRPLSLLRCPSGVGADCFFQKHAWAGLNNHVLRVDIGEAQPMLAIETLDGLISLVQAGVLEIHPWGSRIDDLDHPDLMTFDLDPGESVPWDAVCRAAVELRGRLADFGLESFCKTTGGKGLHVALPLRPKAGWEEAKLFARELAERMAGDSPKLYVAVASKAARPGRIFIDYLRNSRGATAVAAYSTRARPGAPVSTPIAWDELAPQLRPDRFKVANCLARLDSLSQDPWARLKGLRQDLPNRGRKTGRKLRRP